MHSSLNPWPLLQNAEPAQKISRPPGSIGMSGCPTVVVVVLTPLKRLTVWLTAFIGEIGALSVSAFAEVRMANRAKADRCMIVVTGVILRFEYKQLIALDDGLGVKVGYNGRCVLQADEQDTGGARCGFIVSFQKEWLHLVTTLTRIVLPVLTRVHDLACCFSSW